jgi:hypothetical protein
MGPVTRWLSPKSDPGRRLRLGLGLASRLGALLCKGHVAGRFPLCRSLSLRLHLARRLPGRVRTAQPAAAARRRLGTSLNVRVRDDRPQSITQSRADGHRTWSLGGAGHTPGRCSIRVTVHRAFGHGASQPPVPATWSANCFLRDLTDLNPTTSPLASFARAGACHRRAVTARRLNLGPGDRRQSEFHGGHTPAPRPHIGPCERAWAGKRR